MGIFRVFLKVFLKRGSGVSLSILGGPGEHHAQPTPAPAADGADLVWVRKLLEFLGNFGEFLARLFKFLGIFRGVFGIFGDFFSCRVLVGMKLLDRRKIAAIFFCCSFFGIFGGNF